MRVHDVATWAGSEADEARSINADFIQRIVGPVSAPSAEPAAVPAWGGDWTEEVAVAADLTQRALAMCKHVQASLAGDGRDELMRLKGDMTPVTAADLAVQALVSLALARRFPGDVLVAEEDAGLLRLALPGRAADRPADADAARGLMAAVCALLRRYGGPHLPADGGDEAALAVAVVEAVGRRRGGGAGAGRGWVTEPVDGPGLTCSSGPGLTCSSGADLTCARGRRRSSGMGLTARVSLDLFSLGRRGLDVCSCSSLADLQQRHGFDGAGLTCALAVAFDSCRLLPRGCSCSSL
jgi:hypothetical protein